MADSKGRKARRSRRSGRRNGRRPWLRWLLLGVVAAGISCGGLLIYYTAVFNRIIDARLNYQAEAHTAVLAADGTFLSNLWSGKRQRQRPVPFAELPAELVEAVLAAEDERFFEHSGVDPLSILRALLVNIGRREAAQGGSTLTQQYVKNTFLTSEKTLRRKLQEVYFAWLLERRLSKEQIFDLYANTVYLGQYDSFAVAGFGEGAAHFFSKRVSALELHEAALLAGLIQAPNRYSPERHPEAALERRNHVLRLMEDKGFITAAEGIHAARRPLAVSPAGRGELDRAAYFVEFVRTQLLESGVDWTNSSDFEVHTTLEPALQASAERAVKEGMEEVVGRHPRAGGAEAALVALRPDGTLVALVGGIDYGRSQFNRALRARRQPGSTFKPFVLAAALEASRQMDRGLTLASHLEDAPHTFHFGGRDYSPRNANDRYHGTVTLRETVSWSLNVPTVRLAESVGFETVADFSRRAGFPESHLPYPSIALGTFEVTPLGLARAYAVLASGGRLPRVTAIRGWARDGVETRLEFAEPRQAISPEVAFLVTSTLESAVDSGTAREVRARGFALPVAGKTGTTDDSWFAGYTPDLLCVVWVGFDDSRPLGLGGGQAALQVWTRFMKNAYRAGQLSGEAFAVPPGIVSVEVDPDTGLRSGPGCAPGSPEFFIAGTQPLVDCQGRSYFAATADEGGLWGWIKKIF